MRTSAERPQYAFLYLGAFAPMGSGLQNSATSTAGDLFQTNFLSALATSDLPSPEVHAYVPVASFPKNRRLFFFGTKTSLPNGLAVQTLSHINLGALKIATLGLSSALRTIKWGWRNRRAQNRIVICYNLTAPPAWPIKVACRLAKLTLVPFIGDIYVPGEVVKDTWLRRLEFAGQKRIIPQLDGLLIANQAIVDDFAPNRHALLMEGGVMESMVRRFEKPANNEREFKVVFAGQMSVLNGVTLLLDALKLIDMPDLKVTILGGGEHAEKVSEAAKQDSRIDYRGLVSHEEVLQAYESADLLLNLRRTDYQTQRYVFPSKVVECLSTGRPLLTTTTGHVQSEFNDFVYTLSDESPLALATKIQEIANLPREERQRVGVEAQAYVLANKTWEAHARRLQNYLEQTVLPQKEAA